MNNHKHEMIKNGIEIVIGLIITAVIVYFTLVSFGKFDPRELLASKVNWWLAALSAILFCGAAVVRSFVYTYGIDKNLKLLDALRITIIGNASNMVLPFRMGEAVRLAFFPKGYSAMKRVRLTVVPGAVDIGMVLIFSIFSVYIAGFNRQDITKLLNTVLLIFLLICILAVLMLFTMPKTSHVAESYLNFDTLRMVLWVFLSWLIMLFSIWMGFVSIGSGVFNSIRYALASFASMNLVMLIPSSPGGIGLFEYSVVNGLSLVGVDSDFAKAAGILLHGIQYAALLPAGIILYLAGSGLLRKLLKKLKLIRS